MTDLTTLSLALTEQSDSPFHSNHSSGIFSLGTAPLDSTTDFDSQNTESDSSGSSEEPTNEVVKNLDCRLLSVLNGNLDLAARLMPKIHNLLNEEDRLPSIGNSVFQHENRLSNVKSKGSNGKQMVSGDSSSAPTSKNGPSEGSPQKHGRGSEECDGQEEGNSSNCKRHRQGSEGGSEDTHGGDSEGDPVENPGADTVGTPGDDTFSHPYGAPDKNPEDPGGDPGDDPSLAESLDNVPNFACHFYKLDPIKYGPWTDNKYEKCPGSRITALRRIK